MKNLVLETNKDIKTNFCKWIRNDTCVGGNWSQEFGQSILRLFSQGNL